MRGIIVPIVDMGINFSLAGQAMPAPQLGAALDGLSIGLGALVERMLILMEIDQRMSSNAVGVIDAIAAWF